MNHATCLLLGALALTSGVEAQSAARTAPSRPATAHQATTQNQSQFIPGTRFRRCGTVTRAELEARLLHRSSTPTDCGADSTNPDVAYSPASLPIIEIPLVFHVISNTMGDGNVSDAMIRSQIDILNEDFRARANTPGANGVDTRIQFRLAQLDAAGNPTNGIVRYTNDGWYDDSDQTYVNNAWDPQRYCNVYTNEPGGSLLGYASFPQEPTAGTNVDRITVKWQTIGRDAPIGLPANGGRTMTHEMGHQLGLYHVFEGDCASTGGCYNSGDTICDTNSQMGEYYGCAPQTTCGSPDPVSNYMNYSEDACMQTFTEEQARRMRCSIMFYRPMYAHTSSTGTPYCTAVNNSTGRGAFVAQTGNVTIASNNLVLVASDLPQNATGFFIASPDAANVPMIAGGIGTLCVGANTARFNAQAANSGAAGVVSLAFNNTMMPRPNGTMIPVTAGQTWRFQCWFRDGMSFNFSNGYEVVFQ